MTWIVASVQAGNAFLRSKDAKAQVPFRTCKDFKAGITEVCRQSFSSQGNSCIVGWVVMVRTSSTLHHIPYLLQTKAGWGIAPIWSYSTTIYKSCRREPCYKNRIVEAEAMLHTITASLNSRNFFLFPYHTLNMDINSGNLILPLWDQVMIVHWLICKV